MPNCSVFSCKKRSDTSSLQKDNVTFHLFSKVPMIRDVWTRACANHVSWSPKRTSTLCSQHFEACCFIKQSVNKRKLKQFAVPTLNLPKVVLCEESKTEIIPNIETCEDSLPFKTQECKSTKEQLPMSDNHNCGHNLELSDTPRTIKLKKTLKMKNKQIKRLQSQNRYLKKKVAEMQQILNELSEKPLTNKENHLVLDVGEEGKDKNIPI